MAAEDGSVDLEGTKMAIDMESVLMARLGAHMDRLSSDAVTFSKALEFQYLSGQTFTNAHAARVLNEAGSGRTRAETNGPTDTSASHAKTP